MKRSAAMYLPPKELLESLKTKISVIQSDWHESIIRKDNKLSHPNMFQKVKNATGLGGVSSEQIAEKTRQSNNVTALLNALNGIQLSSDMQQAYGQIRQAMMIGYITEYAQGREGKEVTKLLTQIEDAILTASPNSEDNYLMKNQSLALKQGKGHEHFDSRFLATQYEIVDTELPGVVKHLFSRVVEALAGNSETNKAMYVNCMKALVRVGVLTAIPEWNELAKKHFGSPLLNPFQITLYEAQNADSKLSESALKDKFDVVRNQVAKHPNLAEKIITFLGGRQTATPSSSAASPVASSAAQSVTDEVAPPPMLSTFAKKTSDDEPAPRSPHA
jgi:hypothetical protein